MSSQQPTLPNYFELLELDPTAPWDEDAFEKALTSKRAEWTKGSRHPKHATRYHSYLDAVPQMIAAMNDPTTREKLAAEAQQNQQAQQQQLQIQFNDQLDLLVAKGFVTEADIAALAKTYHAILTEQDIRETMQRRGIDIREGGGDGDAIDSGTLKTMQTQLDVLGKRDLYDFLGMRDTANTADLLDAGKKVYDDAQKKATKTAAVTAQSMLAGYAMRFFGSEDERQRYDAARADRAYEAVLGEPLLRLLQGGDKMLYAGQFQKLLEQARAHRLDLDRAREYVLNRARQLGAAIEIVDAAPIANTRLCPNCAFLNEPTASICANCGTALRMTCPGCGNTIPTEHNFCTHCNFPIGDLFVIKSRLDAAFELLRDRQFALAEEKITAAWYLRNKLPAQQHANKLLTDIDGQFEVAENELSWQQEKLSQLRALMDARRFYAARELLRDLQEDLGQNALHAQQQQIESTIADVEQRLKAARAAEGDAAVQLYVDILADCADCAPARDELARIPPGPPTDLRVQQGGELVRLEWEPSSAKNVQYVVVRKAGAPPISAGDGVTLTTTPHTRVEDTAPENGRPLFYAVYAERGGIVSADGAEGDGYAMFVAPVTGLGVRVDAGKVALDWTPPENAAQLIIRRDTSTYPTDPDAGTGVLPLNLAQAVDTDVANETTYYYSVWVEYVGLDGLRFRSEPAHVAATPQEPPAFIEKLRIEVLRTGVTHTLRLHYDDPAKGDAAVLQTERPPAFYAHQILPATEVTAAGQMYYGGPEGHVQLDVESARIVYFTPVVLFSGMAYIGKTTDYASLEDVHNLEVKNMGHDLQLRWDWPRHCERVIVAYSPTHYPTPSDYTDVTRVEVTRAQYQREFFTLRNAAQTDYYFAVFAIIRQDGQELTASGFSARAHAALSSPLEIRYTINTQRRLLGSNKLFLALDLKGEGRVPDMVLVRQKHAPPHSRSAGEVVLHVKGSQVTGKTHRVELPEGVAEPQSYVGLFLVEENAYESRGGHVRIMKPSVEGSKVG
jgi:hypothetical protein